MGNKERHKRSYEPQGLNSLSTLLDSGNKKSSQESLSVKTEPSSPVDSSLTIPNTNDLDNKLRQAFYSKTSPHLETKTEGKELAARVIYDVLQLDKDTQMRRNTRAIAYVPLDEQKRLKLPEPVIDNYQVHVLFGTKGKQQYIDTTRQSLNKYTHRDIHSIDNLVESHAEVRKEHVSDTYQRLLQNIKFADTLIKYSMQKNFGEGGVKDIPEDIEKIITSHTLSEIQKTKTSLIADYLQTAQVVEKVYEGISPLFSFSSKLDKERMGLTMQVIKPLNRLQRLINPALFPRVDILHYPERTRINIDKLHQLRQRYVQGATDDDTVNGNRICEIWEQTREE